MKQNLFKPYAKDKERGEKQNLIKKRESEFK